MIPHQYLSKIISQPLALNKLRGRTIIRALAAGLWAATSNGLNAAIVKFRQMV